MCAAHILYHLTIYRFARSRYPQVGGNGGRWVMGIETRSVQRCFGGMMGFYTHRSVATDTDMRFAVFVPPQAGKDELPTLYYLAGLTCTEETFMIKAGEQRMAVGAGNPFPPSRRSPIPSPFPGGKRRFPIISVPIALSGPPGMPTC
jgi:hypothetical protein